MALCHGCPDRRRTHHYCCSYYCYYRLPLAAPSLLLSPEAADMCLLEESGRSYNFIPSVLPPKDFEVGIMFKSSQASHVIPLTGAPSIEVGPAIPSFVSLRAASLPRAVAFLPYRLNCLHHPLCHHLAILLTRPLKGL